MSINAVGSGDQDIYELLIGAITDYAIYVLDPEGIVRTWNPGAERFKGYTSVEIIGQHFSRFYTEEDRKIGLPKTALEIAARDGKFEQEGWRIRKDGTRMWAHIVIDPIRAASGTLIGYAKITRDVSDRRKANEDLRRSEERFRLLVQGIRDYAIYMLDPHGIVTNWNAGAERFKGYAELEIVGQHFSRFYTDEDRALGIPVLALETAEREGRFVTEGWRVRKDGTRFWADVVIDALRDDNGALLGFAKITRDVTERREAAKALEETRSKLVQSQKMEMIGQLTGGVAHDFNNLLAVILGNMDLLRRRGPTHPKADQLMENSIEAARRGVSLTQRMLAFARRQDLKTEQVDVSALIRNMADLMERSINPDIQITMQFPLDIPPAMADSNQLELAILNLAVNARDAMPAGGTIKISARMDAPPLDRPGELKPGKYICLSVQDAGMGMDPETLSRSVEPFFTTKGVGKGTGLGLSMVHGFATQSGGAFNLKSDVGIGTTAELWLPVATHATTASPVSQANRECAIERLRILVVDDDGLVLANTAAVLEDLGHVVLQAASGKMALDVLDGADEVDLVITDQLMPGMSGSELGAAIHATKPNFPLIVATGYADHGSTQDSTVVRLSKPFAREQLVLAIAAAVTPNR